MEFCPSQKFKDLETRMGANLLNPFGSVGYEDHDNEVEELSSSQENHASTGMSALDLSDLADEECTRHNSLSCTIKLPDGKHVHKARVLHEFTKYLRQSNLTDHLRRVANISKFAQPAPAATNYGEDGSITETELIFIQDPVAMILQCNRVPFLAIAQVNLIKVDGSIQTYVNKDVLSESTVSIGIQVLSLRPGSVRLADGREGDWVWEQGYDVSLTIPGKHLHQISPEIVSNQEGCIVAFGFCSDELHDLTAMMFQSLGLEDVTRLIDTQMTEKFPYKFKGMFLHLSED